MKEIKTVICPLCKERVRPEWSPRGLDAVRYSCCGKFELSGTLSSTKLTETAKQDLRERINNANRKGKVPCFKSHDIRKFS